VTVESDVKGYLDAQTYNAPVFMGPVRPSQPPEIPYRCVFVLATGGPPPIPYMDGTRIPYRSERTQIRVRGEPYSYATTQFLANNIWSAMQQASSAMTGSYVRVTCDQSQPMYMGQDSYQCPEFVVNLTLEGVSGTIPNIVSVPTANLPTSTEATITTIDATLTTLATIVVPDGTRKRIEISALAESSAGAAMFKRYAVVRADAGVGHVAYQVPASDVDLGLGGAPDISVSMSGNNAIISVKGVSATTVQWEVLYTVITKGP